MEDVRSAISVNLSNQANANGAVETDFLQCNCALILGLNYLESEMEEDERIPVTVYINGEGELTIKGLDEDIINSDNVLFYTDRKVTKSEP